MDKARMTILSSVPVVMALNLALLNHYFGNPTIVVNNKTKDYSNYSEIDNNIQNNQYKVPKFFNTKKKLNVTVVPPPPPHIFVGVNE